MQQEFISFVRAVASPLKHSDWAKEAVEVKFSNMRQQCLCGYCTRTFHKHWSSGMRSVGGKSDGWED